MQAELSTKSHGVGRKLTAGSIQFLRNNAGILMGLLGMCIALSLLTPSFLTKENIFNILRQVTTNANLAFAMTLIIIICGIDLSTGSILAVSGTLTAGLIALNGMPVYLAVLMGLLVGTGLGLFNGVVIARTGIPPFIVTLAMMQIARGAAFVYTGGMPVRTLDPDFNIIGSGYLGPIPVPVIYTAIVFIGMVLLLDKTQFGRHVYAVGGNRDAARFSGINIKKIEIVSYTLMGFLSAMSGIVLCARMYSGQPTVGQGFEMDAIAAAILGGTSFSGGTGTMGGTLIGVFVIGVLNNGLNLLNVSSFWQLIIKGVVILLAVYVDMLKKKKKGRGLV